MTAPLPDQLLEEEIRAMLQRRAQDVDPTPPPWRELAQRNGAVVISLRTGNPVDPESSRWRRRPGRQWVRGVVAAAVALIVAMVGALVVQGSGTGTSDSADGPEVLEVPAAGNTDFDPAQATPLFPVTDDESPDIAVHELSDPVVTTQEYLRSVGFPVGEDWMVIDSSETRQSSDSEQGGPPVQIATVGWSLHAKEMPEKPAMSTGVVFLRNPERAARDTWLVVGVLTFDLRLTDVRRDGDELSFVVDRSAETETFQTDEATVSVDGQPIGEVGYHDVRPFSVPSPAGAVAIIKLQHVIDGEPWSITSTAVPALPGAPVVPPEVTPPPTTAIAGGADRAAVQIGQLVERVIVVDARGGPVSSLPGAVIVEPADPAVVDRRAVSER